MIPILSYHSFFYFIGKLKLHNSKLAAETQKGHYHLWMTHPLVEVFLGCVSEVVPFLPSASLQNTLLVLVLGCWCASLWIPSLPGYRGCLIFGILYTMSPEEVKGCHISPASVTGKAEKRRMKIPLRQAGTERSKAEKGKQALDKKRPHGAMARG